MVDASRPPKHAFNATARKIYNPLGFSKAYNFILWFIFAGALLGFTLARFMYLDFSIFCGKGEGGGNSAAPGECYYYANFSWYKTGIYLHLVGVLVSSLIAVFQFTPFIRHKAIIVHRIGGYAALLFWTVGVVGAFMIARRAFGGGLDVQSWVGTVGIASTASFVLSYINIKRLQIEQHRAWMLRGWFYAGSIITCRFIMIIGATTITKVGSYYTSWPCAKINYVAGDATAKFYPECASYLNGTNPSQEAVVHADMTGLGTEVGAALNMSFGMALWVATVVHAVGVEIYLHLTPREAERLRNVSYQRQIEAGMKNPGSAGLTVDRFGDADPWMPQSTKSVQSTTSTMTDQPPMASY